jgi:hypothetical protein
MSEANPAGAPHFLSGTGFSREGAGAITLDFQRDDWPLPG